VVIYRRFGTTCRVQSSDRLSRNVGKYLPIYAAKHSRSAKIFCAFIFSPLGATVPSYLHYFVTLLSLISTKFGSHYNAVFFFHYPTISTLSGPDILLSAMLVSQTHDALPKKDRFHTRTFSGSCFRATGSSPLLNSKLANQNVTLN